MISYNDAIAIIEVGQSFPVKRIRDFGEKWVVELDTGDPAIPGIPLYFVNKETGIVEPFSMVLDIETAKKIAEAPIVWNK